jgi:hypothetical protein
MQGGSHVTLVNMCGHILQMWLGSLYIYKSNKSRQYPKTLFSVIGHFYPWITHICKATIKMVMCNDPIFNSTLKFI